MFLLSDQETGEVIAHLLKKADEIQHLLEDGVDITNLLIPLESVLRRIREILLKNRADPVQSLGNNLQHVFKCIVSYHRSHFCNGI